MSNIILADRQSVLPAHRPLPRQQLVIRTIDGVCFITMPVRWQRAGMAAVAALLAGVAALAWGYQTVRHRLATNDVEIVQAADAYQATIQHLEGSISQLHGSVTEAQRMATAAQEGVRRDAQRRHQVLTAVTVENAELRQRINSLRSEIETARADIEARPRMPSVVRGSERIPEPQPDAMVDRLRALEGQMRTLGRGNAQISGAAALLQRHIEEFEGVRAPLREVETPLMQVPDAAPAPGPRPRRDRTSALGEPQGGASTLQQARDRAHASVRVLGNLVRRTGVDPEQALAVAGPTEDVGGPLIPVPVRATIDAGLIEMQGDLSHYGATIERRADLLRLLRSMPLGQPVPDSDVVSGFGIRRDPFNGDLAMHGGLDLRAAPGTPVSAAAGGVVTVAETSGAYGQLVEIAHGFGLRTRYGHLSRIDVAAGARVEVGQTIGRVGNTGRSTGPHLHYEILFQQANLDPQKFLEVSRYVLANVQRRFQ